MFKIIKYLFILFLAMNCTNNKISDDNRNSSKTVLVLKKKIFYWNFIKKDTGFNKKQIKQLRKIETQFTNRIEKLKIQKTWFGVQNQKKRKTIWKQKDDAIKKNLNDNQFSRLKKSIKKWNNKSKNG